ncbi:unnamed protein product [Closterium sp. Naga37s-1]|nr:unnamed protein product [Closterium sp. Naga37s-1]
MASIASLKRLPRLAPLALVGVVFAVVSAALLPTGDAIRMAASSDPIILKSQRTCRSAIGWDPLLRNFKQLDVLRQLGAQSGSEFEFSKSWTASGAPLKCSKYQGVTCDAEGKIVAINATSARLVGPIDALSTLDQLQSLDLSYNGGVEVLPQSFTKLKKLIHLKPDEVVSLPLSPSPPISRIPPPPSPPLLPPMRRGSNLAGTGEDGVGGALPGSTCITRSPCVSALSRPISPFPPFEPPWQQPRWNRGGRRGRGIAGQLCQPEKTQRASLPHSLVACLNLTLSSSPSPSPSYLRNNRFSGPLPDFIAHSLPSHLPPTSLPPPSHLPPTSLPPPSHLPPTALSPPSLAPPSYHLFTSLHLFAFPLFPHPRSSPYLVHILCRSLSDTRLLLPCYHPLTSPLFPLPSFPSPPSSLSDTRLYGEVPKALGGLVKLRELYLNNGWYYGPLPDLSALKQLTLMYASLFLSQPAFPACSLLPPWCLSFQLFHIPCPCAHLSLCTPPIYLPSLILFLTCSCPTLLHSPPRPSSDLSGNYLSGPIPAFLQRVKKVNAADNYFSGSASSLPCSDDFSVTGNCLSSVPSKCGGTAGQKTTQECNKFCGSAMAAGACSGKGVCVLDVAQLLNTQAYVPMCKCQSGYWASHQKLRCSKNNN